MQLLGQVSWQSDKFPGFSAGDAVQVWKHLVIFAMVSRDLVFAYKVSFASSCRYVFPMLRPILLALTFLGFVQIALADTGAPDLISGISFFREPAGAELSLNQAQERFQEGKAKQAERRFLSFGISRKAVWVRLSIDNPAHKWVQRRLTAGQIWVGNLDVYQPMRDGVVKHWHSGDWQPADSHLLPVIGYTFDLNIPPGRSEIFIRAQALDPLTLPIELLSSRDAQTRATSDHLNSGVLYGVLLTLVGLNLVLFTAFSRPEALFYSIYIGCFIVMNLGYNGYAFAWVYPGSALIQNYCTLFFMVLHGVCGLMFVSSFLDLARQWPGLFRLVRWYIAIGLIAIVAAIIARNHFAGSFIAFGYLSLTTLVMILVGILSLSKVPDARYFLLAVCCSMLGMLSTTLSVWGIIPYTFVGYHGAEIGVLFEAVILATIIGHHLRVLESERITSQFLARHDPLTGLLNRHALESVMKASMLDGRGSDRPASLIMMDIDDFKSINDTHGHLIGDEALRHVSAVLRSLTRPHDVVARWGGEEIALFLPDTDQSAAVEFAESLRASLASSPLQVKLHTIRITASFGVASRRAGEAFEDLFWRVDERLYEAKHAGRNRVFPEPAKRLSTPEWLASLL